MVGASPAKLSCLVVNSLAACCLFAKSSAVSPGCLDIPAIPGYTPEVATPIVSKDLFLNLQ